MYISQLTDFRPPNVFTKYGHRLAASAVVAKHETDGVDIIERDAALFEDRFMCEI